MKVSLFLGDTVVSIIMSSENINDKTNTDCRL